MTAYSAGAKGMARRVRGVALAVSAALSSFAYGTGFGPLYEEAKASDPQYAAARADFEAAETLIPQARGQLLPQVSVTGGNIKNTYAYEQRSAIYGSWSKDYRYTAKNASLNLSLAVLRPQVWIGLAQSYDQVQIAEGQFRDAAQNLILRLAQAYFEALLAEDNVGLAAEQKAAITQQLKQAKRYFEAGEGTVTDINEAQARYDTIVAQELAAQNNLEIKLRTIEQVVGKVYRRIDRLGNRLKLEAPFPADVESWLDFAQDHNPLLKAREAALAVAEKEVHKSWASHLPTVDLVASRSRSEDPSFTMINTVSWDNAIGFQVSIPLFSGGTTQAHVRQASSQREKANFDVEGARRYVVLNTRQEYLNVINGVAQVKALEQAVKSNELALHSAQKGQEAGLRTSFDVLNAQQLLFSAKRDLAQARYAYVLARLRLRAAAGLLDEDDVSLVQTWLDS